MKGFKSMLIDKLLSMISSIEPIKESIEDIRNEDYDADEILRKKRCLI